MDLDQTQAIELDDYHEDTDEEAEQGRQPVSFLKVFRQKGFPETKFPLFEGDNVIGRQQDVCNVHIPIKALSKQHACIEIRGNSHLIYDKGSRNKTKRGKLYLSPSVRYEIRPGDEISMADISCVYLHKSDGDNEAYDSGSETGSESMFQTAQVLSDTVPDTQGTEEEGRQKFMEATRTEVVEDDDDVSNTSSDLLQPTQLFGSDLGEKARKGRLHEATTLMFAEDSDHSDVEAGSNRKRKTKNVTVEETPYASRIVPTGESSTLVLNESDCEDGKSSMIQTIDFEEVDLVGKEGILAAQTQAYVLESDVEDDDEQDKSDSFLLGAPTQAYDGVLEESENGVDESSTGNNTWNGVDESTEAETTGDALTLAYDATFDETANESVLTAATQAYGSNKNKSLKRAEKEIQDKNCDDLEEFSAPGDKKVGDEKETQSFEVTEKTKHCHDEESSEDSAVGEDFFAAPTMACDLQDDEDVNKNENDQSENIEDSSKSRVEDATQFFETVPVETSPVKSSANRKVHCADVDQTSTQNLATVPIEISQEKSPVRASRRGIPATVDQTAILPDMTEDSTQNLATVPFKTSPEKLPVRASRSGIPATVDQTAILPDMTEDSTQNLATVTFGTSPEKSPVRASRRGIPANVDQTAILPEMTEDSTQNLATVPFGTSPGKSPVRASHRGVFASVDQTASLPATFSDNFSKHIEPSITDGKACDNTLEPTLAMSEIDGGKNTGAGDKKDGSAETLAPTFDISEGDQEKTAVSDKDEEGRIIAEPTQPYDMEDEEEDSEKLLAETQILPGNISPQKKPSPRKSPRKGKHSPNGIDTGIVSDVGVNSCNLKEKISDKKSSFSKEGGAFDEMPTVELSQDDTPAISQGSSDEPTQSIPDEVHVTIPQKQFRKSRGSSRRIPEIELEATQAEGEDEEIVPKKSGKSKSSTRKIKEVELEPTQEEEMPPNKSGTTRRSTLKIQDDELESTQAYMEQVEQEIELKKLRKSRRSTCNIPEIQSEATQAYGEEEEIAPTKSRTSRRSIRNIQEVELEATQAYGEEEEVLPKKSEKSRRSTRKVPEIELEATQAYGEDEEEVPPKKSENSKRSTRKVPEIEFEATQAYGEEEEVPPKKSEKSKRNTRKVPEIVLEATQAYEEDEDVSPKKSKKSRRSTRKVPEIELEATQAYGEEEEEVPPKKSEKSRRSTRKVPEIILEATQAYEEDEELNEEKTTKSNCSTRNIPEIELEATQAYEEEEEISPRKSGKSKNSNCKNKEIVLEATQAYCDDDDKETNGTEPGRTGDAIIEPTQNYDMLENITDDVNPEEKIKVWGSSKRESSSEEIVPDSCSSQENTPVAIPLPSHSPHKSSLASPGKKHISPKKVVFDCPSVQTDSENGDTEPIDDSGNVDTSTKQQEVVGKSSVNQVSSGTSRTGRHSRRSVQISGPSENTIVDNEKLSAAEEPSPLIPMCSHADVTMDKIEDTDTDEEDPTVVKSKTTRGKGKKSAVASSAERQAPSRRGRRSAVKSKESAETSNDEASESGSQQEEAKAQPEDLGVSRQARKRVSRQNMKKSHATAPEEETIENSEEAETTIKSTEEDSVFKEPAPSRRRVRSSKTSESRDEQPDVPPPETRRGRGRKSTETTVVKTEPKRLDRNSSASDRSSEEISYHDEEVPKENLLVSEESEPVKATGRQKRLSKLLAGSDTNSDIVNTHSYGAEASDDGADNSSHVEDISPNGEDMGSHGKDSGSQNASTVEDSKPRKGRSSKRNTISTTDDTKGSNTTSRRRTIAKCNLNAALNESEPSTRNSKRGKTAETSTNSVLEESVCSDTTSRRGRLTKTSSATVSEESVGSDTTSRRGRLTKTSSATVSEESVGSDTTSRRGRSARNSSATDSEESATADTRLKRGRQLKSNDPVLDLNISSDEKRPKRGRSAQSSENSSLSDSIALDESIAPEETHKEDLSDLKDNRSRSGSSKRSYVKNSDKEVSSKTPARRDRKVKTLPEENVLDANAETSKTSQSEENVDPNSTPDAVKPNNRKGKGKRKSVASNKTLDTSSVSPRNETPVKSQKGKAKLKLAGSGDRSEKLSSTEVDSDFKPPQKKGRKSTPTGSQMSNKQDENVLSSPTTRRKSMGPKPKVMFTGVVDENGQKITKELGGELVNSVYDCTHLVTDQVRRTVKFLCCLARGLPIVVPQWLNACKDAGHFIDPTPFLVKDNASEKKFKFSLQKSIEKADTNSLLTGYKIHVTKSVRPEPIQMKDIIQCAGAEYLKSMPVKGEDGVYVVSCEEDRKLCEPALSAGVPVLTSEFLLSGILKQEILTESFRLFEDVKKKTPNKRLSTQTSAAASKKRRK